MMVHVVTQFIAHLDTLETSSIKSRLLAKSMALLRQGALRYLCGKTE